MPKLSAVKFNPWLKLCSTMWVRIIDDAGVLSFVYESSELVRLKMADEVNPRLV